MSFNDVLLEDQDAVQRRIITPVAPYFICQHFISDEVHAYSNKYIGCQIPIAANNLLLTGDYDTIQNGDIVQVQVDRFDFFCDTVLPLLQKKGIQIILITSQWHLPQIHRNDRTDSLLHNPCILFWIAQNPIYPNGEKYMAFPYGICHLHVQEYMQFVQQNARPSKTRTLFNGHASVHGHLPPNHIRRKYALLCGGPALSYAAYLEQIAQSEFAISTSGDRDDCYRHYECIGLHAIPISDTRYTDIFEKNMVYSCAEDMVKLVETNSAPTTYAEPNRDILTISFWLDAIHKKRLKPSA